MGTHTYQQTVCGTPAFIAPEVVKKGKHTTKTDIWSLGVTVYNMLTGDLPFLAEDRYTLLLNIASGKLKAKYPEGFDPQARAFIDACLESDPSLRPSASCLLQLPFITQQSRCSSAGSIPSLKSELESSQNELLENPPTEMFNGKELIQDEKFVTADRFMKSSILETEVTEDSKLADMLEKLSVVTLVSGNPELD